MTDTALEIAVPLIAEFEGFSAVPYQDSAGIATIGYGQTYDLSGAPITMQTPPMTEADAQTHLAVLVSTYMEKVRGMVHVPATDAQIAALVSLSYNIGSGALRQSSLMLAFNQGHTQEAADAFLEWIHAGGKVNTGLRNRRAKERALFLSDAPVEMSADQLMDKFNPGVKA